MLVIWSLANILCFPNSSHEINISYYIASSYRMKQRITMNEIFENEWFMQNYQPPRFFRQNFSFGHVRTFALTFILLKYCLSELWI